jgi:hypothetical protein
VTLAKGFCHTERKNMCVCVCQLDHTQEASRHAGRGMEKVRKETRIDTERKKSGTEWIKTRKAGHEALTHTHTHSLSLGNQRFRVYNFFFFCFFFFRLLQH